MQRLGSVLHISSNNNIILKAESPPRIGDKVVDKRFGSVGVVFDIFGPITAPYVAIKPDVAKPHLLLNHSLYTAPSPKLRARKRR